MFDKPVDNGMDYRLMQNGAISLFYREPILQETVLWLRDHGYLAVTVDAASAASATELRASIIDGVPGWPVGYGVGNSNAFFDALHDIDFGEREGVALVFLRFDEFVRREPAEAFYLLDSVESVARWHLLFGHRLMGLVQSDDPLFTTEPLGGHSPDWNPREWLNSKRSGSTTA